MDRQVRDLFCEDFWTIFVVDRCAITSLATDWDPAQTHWLARLPFEMRRMISHHAITPQVPLERSNFLPLSALARTSKAIYLAFQPVLMGDIVFPHRDAAAQNMPGLSLAFAPNLFLVGSVRSIDFTDMLTVNNEPLPQFYSQLVCRYVKRFVRAARRRTDHLKIPLNNPETQRTPGGYPAQLTALLLLTQRSLARVCLTLPRFFWIQDERDATEETKAQEIDPPQNNAGIILRHAPSFPKLTHLALDYPPNARARSDNPRFDPQGDYRVLLAATPNLQSLILRDCNLARLTSSIPPTSTITNGNIGNLPEYVSYNDVKASTLMNALSRPGWPGQHEARIPLHWEYNTGAAINHTDQSHQHYFSRGSTTSIEQDAYTTEKILTAAALSPSALRETIQHMTLGLGSVIDPHQPGLYMEAEKRYFETYHSRFRDFETSGEITTRIHLFPSLKRLTVNCALIMSIHLDYCRSAHDNLLVNLMRPYRSTLETLELTGVNFVGHLLRRPWETLVKRLTSGSSPAPGCLKNVTLLTDSPATSEIAALVSEKYLIPLKEQGIGLVLLVPDQKPQLMPGTVGGLPMPASAARGQISVVLALYTVFCINLADFKTNDTLRVSLELAEAKVRLEAFVAGGGYSQAYGGPGLQGWTVPGSGCSGDAG
ncbi:hypothetical protein V8F06_009270 [Rhypophila decipiens]